MIKDLQKTRIRSLHHPPHRLSDPEDYDRIVSIGAPAEASHADKTAIFDAAAGSANSAMIISEPFAVAYALDMIHHTLVIDIGAGTTDLCRVCRTIEAQATVHRYARLRRQPTHQGDSVQIQRCSNHQDMARRWKNGSPLCQPPLQEPILVDFSIEGKAMTLNITDLQAACESIVDTIVENVKKLSQAQPRIPRRVPPKHGARWWRFLHQGLGALIDDACPTWAM